MVLAEITVALRGRNRISAGVEQGTCAPSEGQPARVGFFGLSADATELMGTITQALQAFPDARMAVLEALSKERG